MLYKIKNLFSFGSGVEIAFTEFISIDLSVEN